MQNAVILEDAGVWFRLARRTRLGRVSRIRPGGRERAWGIRHINLELQPGEVVGVIGPNGAGKTTLLRTVAGVYRPDEGRLIVEGRVGAMLSATAGLIPRLSGWDNIEILGGLLGMTTSQIRTLKPRIAEFAQLGKWLDVEVRTYSSGMKARLGFSIAAFSQPDILVLDEVIAVGDQDFRERSSRLINEMMLGGCTTLVSTHNVKTLSEFCSRLIRLENGAIVDQGAPTDVLDRYLADHGEAALKPGRRPVLKS